MFLSNICGSVFLVFHRHTTFVDIVFFLRILGGRFLCFFFKKWETRFLSDALDLESETAEETVEGFVRYLKSDTNISCWLLKTLESTTCR